jgi:indole-3-glycerol phosphate synthase / phosphoribosylanthranilate isomerase
MTWESAVHRFLEDIIAHRRARIEDGKDILPSELLAPGHQPAPPDPVPALRASGGFIVAEVKKASPSKGPIAPDVDPARQAGAYQRGGASAVSVLSEPDFFSGSREDVRAAAAAVKVPVLCKDFILDPVQLHAARSDGARWALLIARVLGAELRPMVQEAFRTGLEPLVEVHTEKELADAVACGARIVGINSRDLDTFEVDLGVIRRLAPMVPEPCACIAESGIGKVADLLSLRDSGAHGFLIGETLMRAQDPEGLLRGYLSALRTGGLS